jgi:endoglucanase
MSNRSVAWPTNTEIFLLAALLGALGCSNDSHRLGGLSQDASGASTPRVRLCADGADVELIDHMEDRDGAIEMVESRAGVWFSFNDKSVESAQFPASDDETFVMSEVDPPREGSRYAARSHGKGFRKWGAGIGFELYCQKAYDLSRYAGITFWAKREPDTASALRFAVTDSETTPRGGKCDPYADPQECSDYFGADLELGTTFQRYSFSWHELAQKDWGRPRPDSVTTSEVYGLRFQTSTAEPFDFWIDDVALLCHPE